MKLRISGVLVVTLLAILAGCGPSRDDETPEGLSALAGHALESGNLTEALSTYSMALDRYPDDPAVSSWHLGRGRALFGLGRYSQAQAAADAAHEAALDPRSKAMSLLLQGRILLSTGSFENGVQMLSGLELENLDREDSEDAIQLLRQGLEKVSMDHLIENQHTEGWTGVFYLLEIEERYAFQGETEKAILTGMEIDRLYPDAHQRYGRPEIAPEEGGFVALVLPFEGQGATYAQRVRSGVELAFSSSSTLFSSTPELIVFDCSGDSADITEILTSLGANPSCLAVIGPLTSRNAELAAPIAQDWSLPMITPTATSTALDDYGSYVHRLVVSHGDEAAAVAEYAYRISGCSRFAILHSYTSESVASAEQFSSVIHDLGGEVVAMEGYETGDTDFRDQINVIRYQYPDGVFLPVAAWDAIQIAPQLRFYRVEADLFGTSDWDDEILLQQGGEYVEGAVFPVSFGSGSMNPATARFSYFYEREYGEQPNILAAQGYDTAEIVLESWEGRRPGRSSLENRLNDLDVYFGATGMCSIGDASIPRSAYPLVKVTDGEIISID